MYYRCSGAFQTRLGSVSCGPTKDNVMDFKHTKVQSSEKMLLDSFKIRQLLAEQAENSIGLFGQICYDTG